MINSENLPMIKKLNAESDLNRLVRNHTDVLLSAFKIPPHETALVSLFGSGLELDNKEALRSWVKRILLDSPHYVSLPKLRDMLERKLTNFSQGWI